MEDLSRKPLLVKTDYLTIRGTQSFGVEVYYVLNYPRHAVELSFIRQRPRGAKGPELGSSR